MTANEQKYPNVNKIQTNEMENWLKEGVIKNTNKLGLSCAKLSTT